MTRESVIEVAGVVLIAAALAFVHPALAIGAVGVYLFATGVLGQIGRDE